MPLEPHLPMRLRLPLRPGLHMLEEPTAQGPPKMPRWVKVTLIVGLVVLVLVGAVVAFGPGQHGPGRHGSGAGDHDTDTGNHTAPATHHGPVSDPNVAQVSTAAPTRAS